MRVLFLSELFWPYVGGIETVAADLLPRLSQRGYEFHVVATHSYLDLPDDDELNGTPIRRLPFRAAVQSGDVEELVRVRRALASTVREVRPDLVHMFGRSLSMLFYRDVDQLSNLPKILTLQNEIRGAGTPTSDSVTQRTLRSSDWVTACSEAVLRQAREAVPEIEPRSSVIYNSIVPPAADPPPLSLEPPILMCLGRLTDQKGFDLAIAAFARIADSYPSARMIVAGDGDDRGALEGLASSLGVSDRVEFLGLVAPGRVLPLLGTASLVLMPSRWEGLGVVAVQAAMMGRPIVGTDTGGLGEVNLHDRTGLVVEPESPESIADSIAALLDNPSRAASLGTAARDHALANFALDRSVDAYDQLYRRLFDLPCGRQEV